MNYTFDEVMKYIEEEDAKFIRLAFRDAYGTQKNISVMPGEMKKALSADPAIPSLSDEEARQRVSRILESEPFDEYQIMVIAEAMMEELPDRYLLCFLKKEYSADVMRTVKGYCTKAYKEASGL